jgi:hypothetical protein
MDYGRLFDENEPRLTSGVLPRVGRATSSRAGGSGGAAPAGRGERRIAGLRPGR